MKSIAWSVETSSTQPFEGVACPLTSKGQSKYRPCPMKLADHVKPGRWPRWEPMCHFPT